MLHINDSVVLATPTLHCSSQKVFTARK